jgi:hypothetical protein
MHPNKILGGRDRFGARLRLGKRFTVQHHLRAVRFGRLDLHERRRHRHHDGSRNAQPPRMIGDRLGVIAGRHGDDAATALGRGERRQLHAGAALLE